METVQTKRNIVPFSGQRYSIWKLRMRSLLDELNVLKVIDQDPPRPIEPDWHRAERVARNEIIQYLSDSFLTFAQEEDTAKDIFHKLDAIYERKSLPSQLAIRKQLLELKLGSDTALVDHFTTFDDLIIELIAAGAQMAETDKVAHLLLTLPSTYTGVVTALETLSEERITLAFVKTRLLDQEVKIKNEATTSSKVLEARTFGTRNERGHKGKFLNHQSSFKTFYPKNKGNFSNKLPGKRSNKVIIRCHYCGKKNHIKKDCYHYKRAMQEKEEKQQGRPRTIQTVQRVFDSSKNESERFAFMLGNFKKQERANLLTFILDSGASDHIVNRHDVLSDVVDLVKPIKVSVAMKNTFLTATKKGIIPVIADTGEQGVLEDVLYCPDVPHNLLSVKRMQEAGMTVIFHENGEVTITKQNKIILRGEKYHNLIIIRFKVVNCNTERKSYANNSFVNANIYKLWHQRLGHIGKQKFLEFKNKAMLEDVQLVGDVYPDNEICESCINGKQARLPFAKAKDKSYIKRPLFVVHSDVCGPISPPTYNNMNYFVIFIDDYTHYTVIYLLSHKAEVLKVFKDFVAKSTARFNLKIVHFYCDNGREYLSTEFKHFCVKEGISYHLTVPYTPQQNSVSERMIRTVTEKARSMISGADLSKIFWGEAVLTATYLINRTPTKALKVNKTPYEMWHGKKPCISHLRVFGSTVFIHNKTRKGKFDEKSFKCILLGYEPNGYKVWNPETEQCMIVRDVIFDETNFKVTRPVGSINNLNINSLKPDIITPVKVNEQITTEGAILTNENNGTGSRRSVVKTDEPVICDSQQKEGTQENVSLRRSDRVKALPKISYQEDKNDDYNNILLSVHSLFCEVPTSFSEINERDDRRQWEEAINDELKSLASNNTWSIVQRPKNAKIIDCKWVFTLKQDISGNPTKYKARLVAKGFTQQYQIDYDEIFSPVARISTFRILLAIANQYNLFIHHMDVKTAFLHGNLKEEIFMRIPDGIVAQENEVCKLHKSLYGLKQASRCWYELFDATMKEINFINSAVDKCLYVLNKGDTYQNIYVVLYVDDICIATGNNDTLLNFKQYLSRKFKMVDLGEISRFLGINITRKSNSVILDQCGYLKNVLNRFNMSSCKPVKTPLPVVLNFEALNSEETCNFPSRKLIGCLMYAMLCTRPDLSIAVNLLSRYQSKNNSELWKNLKRVLRYIQGSINLKLIYTRNEYEKLLVGYVDSDWGGSITDRKSTTGYIFQLFNSCTICWATKRQNSVATSTTEAEYMALYEGVKEALWLKSLLNSFMLDLSKPITIYEDNTGCISIAQNPTAHKRSKHIDIKYHFSREQIECKTIKLQYLSTDEQVADVLTKPLAEPRFLQLRIRLGLYDVD